MLKGTTVTLYERTQVGTDAFGVPEYTETPVSVDNVLIAPVSTEDEISTVNLTGKHAVYQLGIPKGDAHVWENRRVSFFGQDFRTIGFAEQGIESLVPTAWHRKIKVERWNEQ